MNSGLETPDGRDVMEMVRLLQPHEVKALAEMLKEYGVATSKHGAFHSAHEGYGIILEEMDELFEEVRKKSSRRSTENLKGMRGEAKQVAAMAMRFMTDLTASTEPRQERIAMSRRGDIIGDDGEREKVCIHGVGHPYPCRNPAHFVLDASVVPAKKVHDNATHRCGLHTCEGCCNDPRFFG